MSATFKIAKQKYNQHDLRRLMHEQKSKLQTQSKKKIDSPLAKYNEIGQLTCVLCKSVVRSEEVWKVHINAKQHKENVSIAKKLKEQTQNFSLPTKRPATSSLQDTNIPSKKLKGILKKTNIEIETEPISSKQIPTDFFDLPSNEIEKSSTHSKNDRLIHLNINRKSLQANGDINKMEINDNKDENLPEGFFDDPIMDAKARHLEYRDPIEEEWDKFQKEIREAASLSNAIIAEDQEESTTERQIIEIDEQIRNWSRVLNLEKKKEASNSELLKPKLKRKEQDSDESVSDEEADDFTEFVDWRAKKSFR